MFIRRNLSMTGREQFEIWAPSGAVWSPWAKPVLFAELDNPLLAATLAALPADLNPVNLSGISGVSNLTDHAAAIVVDLPGAESVLAGLALARLGYRPVPLFNNAFHPSAVINVAPILRLLREEAGSLHGLAPDAPPAFLLDAGRMAAHGPIGPGRFDNRWMVFPQDLPSASFLLSRGLPKAVVLQRQTGQPAEDLAHALLRWQEAGIEISMLDPATGGSPQPLRIEKPSRFRALWHRALAIGGLRRNSAGGFGTIIPIPSQGGGGGFA
jgi:hypothetical protein